MYQIRHLRYVTCMWILCNTSFVLIADEMTQPVQTPSLSSEAGAANTLAELQKVRESATGTYLKVRDLISHTIFVTKKFGGKLEKRDEIIQQLVDARNAFESFVQIKSRSIQQYTQQNPATIPAEAYQEIYGIHDALLQETLKLLHNLKEYVASGFKQTFDFGFLITKGDLLINEQVTAGQVLLRCAEIINTIEALKEASDEIGLTRWNKICQAIEKYVRRPCVDYHIAEAALIIPFLTASGLYIYWTSNCDGVDTPREKDIRNQAKKSSHQLDSTDPNPQIVSDPISNKITSKHWFTEFLQKWLGVVPAFESGRYTLEGATDEQKTFWNQGVANLQNYLATQNPISVLIQSGCTLLFTNYFLARILPATKLSIQNWWQQSLGGVYAQTQTFGIWEMPAEIKYEHVIGLDHIKMRLAPALAYASNPKEYKNLGDKIATNYIFYGPKRTGKSHFAKALAGEMQFKNPDMKILNIPCALFSKNGVQETIDMIRSYAPCIAFIDEVDIAGFSRSLDRETTGKLLQALGDGNISPSPDRPVFLIFATNKYESIDNSLNSLGRFGAPILFTVPSFFDRCKFIEVMLMATGHNPNSIDIQKIAAKTEGESFENIKYCISNATLIASLDNIELSTELILIVMNQILYGLYPDLPYELHPETLRILAVNLAGTALTTLLTESNEMLDTVSICKRQLQITEEEFSGFTGKPSMKQPRYEYGALLTRRATITEEMMGPVLSKSCLMRLVAGNVAEEIIFGQCTNSCNTRSMCKAYDLALSYASEGGVAYYLNNYLPNEAKLRYYEKANTLIESCKAEVRTLLTEHRKALDVTVRALQMFGTLPDDFVIAIQENPDEINARLDEFERQQKEMYEKMMLAQQPAV